MMGTDPELERVLDDIHQQLSDQIEDQMESGEFEALPGRDSIAGRIDFLLEDHPAILTQVEREGVREHVLNMMFGLGPIEPFVQDSSVTEIMVNDHKTVFIERAGRIERTTVSFRDEAHLRHVIDRIVAPLGRRVDESSPLVDARLADGSRVNAVIPPLAVHGPALTIRKFAREPFSLGRLVELGTISAELKENLRTAVEKRVSIVISGGTGSGKTTLLNALGLCIPASERLITIEDAAELQLSHPHWVALESRPANIEGSGEVPIRTLVRNALRMRPDRIIVGEVRGGEAFDMLQAMNTGHRGSLTTLHANSPEDALIRLESMVLMAGFEMPVAAIRRMIAGAVELILQLDRRPDGRRLLTGVDRLTRKGEHELTLNNLYRCEAGGQAYPVSDAQGTWFPG